MILVGSSASCENPLCEFPFFVLNGNVGSPFPFEFFSRTTFKITNFPDQKIDIFFEKCIYIVIPSLSQI